METFSFHREAEYSAGDDLGSAIDFWGIGELPAHHDHKILPHLIKMLTSNNNFPGSAQEREFLLFSPSQTSGEEGAAVNTHGRRNFFSKITLLDSFFFFFSSPLEYSSIQHPHARLQSSIYFCAPFSGLLCSEMKPKSAQSTIKVWRKNKMLTCLLEGGKKP